MLCITRKLNEAFFVGKTKITITRTGSNVGLGIEADMSIPILRKEVLDRMTAGEPIHKIREDLDYAEIQRVAGR